MCGTGQRRPGSPSRLHGMADQSRVLELMMRYETRDIFGHGRIIVSGRMRGLAMVTQVLQRGGVSDCEPGHEGGRQD